MARRSLFIFLMTIIFITPLQACKLANMNSKLNTILYKLDYDIASGLQCSILLGEDVKKIEIHIYGEVVSEKYKNGSTYVKTEKIPEDLFTMEIYIYGKYNKLILEEVYDNVLIINAEQREVLKDIPLETEHLFIDNGYELVNIDTLSRNVKLKSLYLPGAQKLSDLKPLGDLIRLQKLNLYFGDFSDISPLAKLINLEMLRVHVNKIENINALAGLTKLKYLDIGHNEIKDISTLSKLTSLKWLQASSNAIENVESLKNMNELEYLVLSFNQIENAEPLSGLSNLSRLFLAGNMIKDVKPLAKLENVEYLNIRNNLIDDFSPLNEARIKYDK